MNKQELEREMTELNYNGEAMDRAEDILEEINEALEEGEDLETILDDFGIYHARVRN
jgi:nucleoid DNA-binding protein